jgi:hypothetical protein
MLPTLLLLVPLVIGIFAAVFRVLWIEPGGGLLQVAVLAARFSATTAAIGIVLGAPAWYLVSRARLRAAWQVTLVGAALGGLSGFLMPLLVGEAQARHFFSGLYPYPVEYAMFGALTAFAAWWFLLRAPVRRKDPQE